jgi:hypothetical protein
MSFRLAPKSKRNYRVVPTRLCTFVYFLTMLRNKIIEGIGHHGQTPGVGTPSRLQNDCNT